MKENLAVIFGGVSPEHDISIISAVQAINNINQNYYNIIPIYITKQGAMRTGKKLIDIGTFSNFDNKKTKEVSFVTGSDKLHFKTIFGFKPIVKIDVALVVMHGLNGEDGKIMSLLDLCGIPYSAPNAIASGVCMDKCIFKEVVKGMKISTIKSVSILKHEFIGNPEMVKTLIIEKLGLPIIIKPATLGSSIGIKVVKNYEQLSESLLFCFTLCNKVLIEKFKEDITEINVAIAGYGNKIEVSELEQPIKQNEILSFENKYMNKSTGMEHITRIMPPNISEEHKSEIEQIAKRIFKELELKGVVRFDFIIDNKKDIVYINELNTIPGSLAFYLFKPKNINYEQLLNKIIKTAYIYKNKEDEIIKCFESSVLNGISGFKGIKK